MTTPPAEKSVRSLLIDVALQGRGVVHRQPAAALGDYSSALEYGEEPAGGFPRRAGQLRKLCLGGDDHHVAVEHSLRASGLDQLREHLRHPALHGLERLSREALIGLAQAAAEGADQLHGDLGMLAQQPPHVGPEDADSFGWLKRL